MKTTLLVAFLFLAISQCYGDVFECYLCDPVNQECTTSEAGKAKCGSNGQCQKQVKTDATSQDKAIRKCVIPDPKGEIPCPMGYKCYNCKSSLCNSASDLKFGWIGLVAVVGVVFYR